MGYLNLQNKGNCGNHEIKCQTLFPIICWLLWKNRTMFVFSEGHSFVQEVVDIGISWTKSYSPSSRDKFHFNPSVSASKWLAPENGWVKLNMDGAVSTSTQSASIVEVIRDAEGSWVCGYSITLAKDEMFLV